MLFKEAYMVVILAEKKYNINFFLVKKKSSDSFQGSSENTGTFNMRIYRKM